MPLTWYYSLICETWDQIVKVPNYRLQALYVPMQVVDLAMVFIRLMSSVVILGDWDILYYSIILRFFQSKLLLPLIDYPRYVSQNAIDEWTNQ
jgi:hypothetical protein